MHPWLAALTILAGLPGAQTASGQFGQIRDFLGSSVAAGDINNDGASQTRVKHTLTDAWQAEAWNMGLLNDGSSAAAEWQSMNTTIDVYRRRKTP